MPVFRTTRAVDDAAERKIARYAMLVVVLLHGGLLLAVRTQLQPRAETSPGALQVILIPPDVALPPPPPWPQPPPRPSRAPVPRNSASARTSTPPPGILDAAVSTAPVETLHSTEDFAAPTAPKPSWQQPGVGTDTPLYAISGAVVPGRTEEYVHIEGMHDAPSPADMVRAVGSYLFGAGEGDSCAKREARLLNETNAVAREIDVRKWRRLCRG